MYAILKLFSTKCVVYSYYSELAVKGSCPVDPCVQIQVVFMHAIDVAISTYNVVCIHIILYEWQLNLTNIY